MTTDNQSGEIQYRVRRKWVAFPGKVPVCQDCGADWRPVRRGECIHCGSDAGPLASSPAGGEPR